MRHRPEFAGPKHIWTKHPKANSSKNVNQRSKQTWQIKASESTKNEPHGNALRGGHRSSLWLCYISLWQHSCGVGTGAFPVRRSAGFGRNRWTLEAHCCHIEARERGGVSKTGVRRLEKLTELLKMCLFIFTTVRMQLQRLLVPWAWLFQLH